MRNKRILSFLVALISLLTLLPAASASSDVYVGQTFYFGSYEQDQPAQRRRADSLARVQR